MGGGGGGEDPEQAVGLGEYCGLLRSNARFFFLFLAYLVGPTARPLGRWIRPPVAPLRAVPRRADPEADGWPLALAQPPRLR